MAGSLNKVQLIGRLGRDPETRNLQAGGSVTSLRLATSESFKNRDGERQEKTEWHSIVIYNEKIGEVAAKYLRKGSPCYVEGQLQTRKWQGQDGQDKYSTEIVLSKFGGQLVLLGEGKGRDADADAERGEAPDKRAPSYAEERARTKGALPKARASDPFGDDDIPF